MEYIKENEIIEDFRNYLKCEDLDEDYIYFQDVNEYLMYMYYEIFDNIDAEERENVEEYIEQVIYKNFEIECDLSEWDFEIQKEKRKILKNLYFRVEKIEKDKNGVSVYLKDKNSDFYCWFDLWKDKNGEYEGDWNKYIFFKDNFKDMVQKEIQENCDAFEQAFYTSLDAMEE